MSRTLTVTNIPVKLLEFLNAMKGDKGFKSISDTIVYYLTHNDEFLKDFETWRLRKYPNYTIERVLSWDEDIEELLGYDTKEVKDDKSKKL